MECANTRVGNMFIPGLTSGQQKRLSLAVAMLKQPLMIFLDEPTSGVDAAGAASIMKFVAEMARESNMIIVATIHQPSSSVFMAFDKVMCLSGGRVCYNGKASMLAGFCEAIRKPIPSTANPADFFLELVNAEFTSQETVEEVIRGWQAKAPDGKVPPKVALPDVAPRPSFGAEVWALTHRTFLLSFRDPVLYISRCVINLFGNIFCAIIFIAARDRTQDQAL